MLCFELSLYEGTAADRSLVPEFCTLDKNRTDLIEV